MKEISEELLVMSVQKLCHVYSGDLEKMREIQECKLKVVEIHDHFSQGSVITAAVAARNAITAHGEMFTSLLLFFKLTVIHAKALASIRLINQCVDPKSDSRIKILEQTLSIAGLIYDRSHEQPINDAD